MLKVYSWSVQIYMHTSIADATFVKDNHRQPRGRDRGEGNIKTNLWSLKVNRSTINIRNDTLLTFVAIVTMHRPAWCNAKKHLHWKYVLHFSNFHTAYRLHHFLCKCPCNGFMIIIMKVHVISIHTECGIPYCPMQISVPRYLLLPP